MNDAFNNLPKCIVIAGPTAGGKTALSVKLALALEGEVINADSMQVYRGMDIGTAKPTETEKQGIPHHIMDVVAPDVVIITETNVPHAENISYFGNGRDEAQMVYNFTLPPLLFYSFVKQDATALSRWARGLQLESPHNTFFNFISINNKRGAIFNSQLYHFQAIFRHDILMLLFMRGNKGRQKDYPVITTLMNDLLCQE